MQRAWIALVITGLAWGCHPEPKKPKPDDPKLVLDPDAELVDWTTPVNIENDCAEPLDLVESPTAPPSDDAIRFSVEPGEVLQWRLAAGTRLWSARLDQTATDLVLDEDAATLYVTDCDALAPQEQVAEPR